MIARSRSTLGSSESKIQHRWVSATIEYRDNIDNVCRNKVVDCVGEAI